jgi:hypothetical protein
LGLSTCKLLPATAAPCLGTECAARASWRFAVFLQPGFGRHESAVKLFGLLPGFVSLLPGLPLRITDGLQYRSKRPDDIIVAAVPKQICHVALSGCRISSSDNTRNESAGKRRFDEDEDQKELSDSKRELYRPLWLV